MKKTTILALFLMLTLVFSAWTPAAAFPGQVAANTATTMAGIPLTITNPMPKATTVTLEGPKKYTFNVPAGGTVNKSIDKGNYKYKYEGCGGKQTSGVLKQKAGTYALNIKPCKIAKWILYNGTKTTTYTLQLKGWMSYKFVVPPGNMKTVEIVAGAYDFTASCGSESWSGKVKVGKNRFYSVC
jgi:hypothetical protein